MFLGTIHFDEHVSKVKRSQYFSVWKHSHNRRLQRFVKKCESSINYPLNTTMFCIP